MATTTATKNRVAAPRSAPSFMSTLASEWTKLTTLKSTYIIMFIGIALALGTAALLTLVIGNTWGDWPAEEQASFDPALYPYAGSLFSLILFSVLGALAVTSEYSSGMIRLTLTATPRRGRVLLAKAIVVTIITLIGGLIVAFGVFWLGQAVFSSYDLPTASLSDADTMQLVLAIGLTTPVFPLIGAALGVLTRSTAGAITSVLGFLFLPSIFGGLLPAWWQENILAYLPGNAGDNIAGIVDQDSLLYLEPGVATAVTIVWVAIFLGAAYMALARRDA